MKDNYVPVNPFVKNHLNSVTNYKKLNNDLNRIHNGVDVFIKTLNNTEKKISNNPLQMLFTGLLGIIPATRRISPIEDNEKGNNRFKAFGLGLLALINLKEDFRDMLSICGLSRSNAPKGYYSKFKFFVGTPVENWLKKTERGQDFFDDWDTTLADTKIGDKIYNYMNIKEDLRRFPKETKFPFCKPEIIHREYTKLEGKFLGRLACLTMNRVTKIGLVFMSLLELPSIYKAIKINDYSQIPKSALNVVSCTVCGGLFSALLSLLTHSPAGSVIGLGLGLFIGNKIQQLIYTKK